MMQRLNLKPKALYVLSKIRQINARFFILYLLITLPLFVAITFVGEFMIPGVERILKFPVVQDFFADDTKAYQENGAVAYYHSREAAMSAANRSDDIVDVIKFFMRVFIAVEVFKILSRFVPIIKSQEDGEEVAQNDN
jgi:hypothetical protein